MVRGGVTKVGGATALLAAALLSAGEASARTVVTLSFDDVRESQLDALPLLDGFGMKASFFVNSNRVGRSGRLTWDQLRAIEAAGHEIGGHTLDHENLTELSDAEARRQVCDDRAALVAQGFDPASFAYPFGDADAGAAAIVGGCGYRTARAHGGISSSTSCSTCTRAESVPPQDPLRLRSSRSVQVTDDLAYLQDRVLLAEAAGGGWINFNFHDVCASCSGTYVIRPALLGQFLAWLAARAPLGTVVLPQGRAFATDAPPPDGTPPSVAIAAPADGATVSGIVTIAATASDDVEVALVEFLVDGAVVGSDAVAPYSTSWDSSAIASGAVTIAARASDAAGNVATSASVTVGVRNDPPPVRTVVTLSFDDVRASQLEALPILDAFGMKASFFVNSARVGRSGRLTWDELRTLEAAGHEIGGHTLDHDDLTELSDAEARRQVCDDRDALVAQGFAPVSFAYPFGNADAGAEAIVGACGYRWARAHGGISSSSSCSDCLFAEPVPPPAPLHLRSSRSIRVTDGLAYLQERVLLAERGGGGWINVNFHDVCASCSGTYVIRPDLLRAFLEWLSQRQALGTVVMPMGRAFGGGTIPVPNPSPDGTAPVVELTAPGGGATVSGTVPLAATATDDDAVALVEFLVDGAVIAADPTAPYEASWSSASVPNGVVTLAARAIDRSSNVGVSTGVDVLVENLGPVSFELPLGSVWKYRDDPSDPGPGWMQAGFDDGAWPEGPGELGYGDGDEATLLQRLPAAQPSVYFRRKVTLPGPSTSASLTVKYDDGVAVFVNGVLVHQANVEDGLAHDVYASGGANRSETVELPAGILLAGDNQLAVVVKQRSASSSDVSFDLALEAQVVPSP